MSHQTSMIAFETIILLCWKWEDPNYENKYTIIHEQVFIFFY